MRGLQRLSSRGKVVIGVSVVLRRHVLSTTPFPQLSTHRTFSSESIAIEKIIYLLQKHQKQTLESDTLGASFSTRLSRYYNRLPLLTSTNETQQVRGEVLELLASGLGTNATSIRLAAQNYTAASETDLKRIRPLEQRLREACTPQYQEIFRSILSENSQTGIRFLVQLRQDLLQYMKLYPDINEQRVAELRQLDTSLKELLGSWFSSETLEIRRITYEHTSASIIEKIATKEAVHPLRSLEDLRRRLGPDKRVYCAFHPLLSDEPLIFVHTALRTMIPKSMDEVLDTAVLTVTSCDDDVPQASVACFYSISSTQPGLAGVDLGQVLLKKAIGLLQRELSASLSTFCTLSPLPRFRYWLMDKLRRQDGTSFCDTNFLTTADVALLQSTFEIRDSDEDITKDEIMKRFFHELQDPGAFLTVYADPLEPLLMKLAARYLLVEKHRGKPLDGVARFHIPNGSEMYRLNYKADMSRKGMTNSLGIMVNYHYKLDEIENNQRLYVMDQRIAATNEMKQWLN